MEGEKNKGIINQEGSNANRKMVYPFGENMGMFIRIRGQ
jgi:hypothetical protein